MNFTMAEKLAMDSDRLAYASQTSRPGMQYMNHKASEPPASLWTAPRLKSAE